MDSQIPPVRQSWKVAFGRSHISPVVFPVKEDFVRSVREALVALGLPTVNSIHMFDPAYWSTPLLDGMVIDYQRYGMASGDLTSGTRVVGFKPLRALCLLLQLDAPRRRFKGEDAIPSEGELRALLDAQRVQPREELKEFARQGFVRDRADLLLLVRSLFGDRWLTDRDKQGLRGVLPADEPWGSLGFSIVDRERLETIGLDVSEAARWREQGFSSRETESLRQHGIELGPALTWKELGVRADLTVRMLPFGLQAVEPWLNAGINPQFVARALEEEIPLEAFLAYRSAGSTDRAVFAFIEGGLEPDAVVEYRSDGPPLNGECYTAKAGLRAKEARAWLSLHLDQSSIWRIVSGGHNIEEARALLRAGLTTEAVKKQLSDWAPPRPDQREKLGEKWRTMNHTKPMLPPGEVGPPG